MTKSRTITGTLELVAIGVPLTLAPLRLDHSLRFVEEIENRAPAPAPEIGTGADLIDAGWWSGVSRYIEDRVPMREQMIALQRSLGLSAGADMLSEKVAPGLDGWLFLRKSLAEDFGTLEQTRRALGLIEDYAAWADRHARLHLLISPDKASVYPEMLTDDGAALLATTAPQRALLRAWFADPTDPMRIDVWSPMLALKESSQTPIYEPMGSHFDSTGAMALGRAMIDAIDPMLWDDSRPVTAWTRTFMPELAKMGGYWDRTETHTRVHLARPGVRCTALRLDGRDVDPTTPIPDGKGADLITVIAEHRSDTADAARLIGGRTLIVHDSAIGNYLRPTLMPYFSHVEFVHFKHMSPQRLREAMDAYDRVFIESVERYFVRRALWLFGEGEGED